MKVRFGMPVDPSHYARELVERLDFKEPSARWLDTVLEHLHLEKKTYSGSRFFSSDEDPEPERESERQMEFFDGDLSQRVSSSHRRRKKPVDAALVGKTIWIDTEFPVQRQRMATGHEVGHYYLPWHCGLTFVQDGCTVDLAGARHDAYEMEASRFAADLLMPPTFFREDMASLPFGLQSIVTLSDKYSTSVEATARHYVDLYRGSCGLLVCETRPQQTAESDSPLLVRYSYRNASFGHFVRPGTEIAMDWLIREAAFPRAAITMHEAPGSALGLRPDRRFKLHCRRWGREGDVLVIVEEPHGNQANLF